MHKQTAGARNSSRQTGNIIEKWSRVHGLLLQRRTRFWWVHKNPNYIKVYIYIGGDISSESYLSLSSLSSNPPGELNILWHDGHPLGMDGTQVGVLEEPNEVRLRCLLKGKHGMALETQISLQFIETKKEVQCQTLLNQSKLTQELYNTFCIKLENRNNICILSKQK